MKVAIVHYWLVNMRGGEKVLESLLEMFPDADIYTHVYDPDAVSEKIRRQRVRTTYIDRLPFSKRLYQLYMPLMPNALMDLDLQGYDLIISSESGPTKGVVPAPQAHHVCFCHTPMRYVWDMYHEYYRGAGRLVRLFMRLMTSRLRVWDVNSANLVDRFVTNSSYVAKRIERYYGRESDVVWAPVEIERFLPVERAPEDFYLFFGQLVGYKRADLAIEACLRSGRKLVVAGSGATPQQRQRYEKSGLVTFTGRISDEEVARLFSRARALIFPGIEDMGIVPIEANAAGCPVIAFRQGGALDTVAEGVTGLFFDAQTPESLIAALDRFEAEEARFHDRAPFSEHVQRFSNARFQERMRRIIEERARR